MRALVIVLSLLSLPAFAQSPKPSADRVGKMPTLIRYEHLMSLSPKQRHTYLRVIARAVTDFESSTHGKLPGGRHAEIESPALRWLAELAVPTAGAAAEADCGPTGVPNDDKTFCYVMNGSSDLVFKPLGSVDPLKELAKTCTYDAAALKTAGDAYSAEQMHDQSCMIGGIASTFKDPSMPQNGCKPVLAWHGKQYCHTPQTLCSPQLFCSGGAPDCQDANLETSKTCWGHSDKTERVDNTARADGETKPCEASTLGDWDTLTKTLDSLCKSQNAKILFCFDCTRLKYSLNLATKLAGPPPMNVSPSQYVPTGSVDGAIHE